jgi:hypothetical protein
MSTVRMRHPSLPEEQQITVNEAAVPHHRSAGWIVVDTPAPEPDPAATEPPQPAVRKRRRTTEGE